MKIKPAAKGLETASLALCKGNQINVAWPLKFKIVCLIYTQTDLSKRQIVVLLFVFSVGLFPSKQNSGTQETVPHSLIKLQFIISTQFLSELTKQYDILIGEL